jgi:hypothetical protein
MNKFATTVLVLLGLCVVALGGWGLLYLPAQMEAQAKRAIEDFNQVLERGKAPLRVTYGAVSGNPIAASVTFTDVALTPAHGAPLRAAKLRLAIDPFSNKISAADASALLYENEKTLLRIDYVAAAGMTELNRELLARAAQGTLKAEDLIKGLSLSRINLTNLTATTRDKGDLRLDEISIAGIRNGKIDIAAVTGLSFLGQSRRGTQTLSLKSMEIKDLDFGELHRVIKKGEMPPYFKAPILTSLAFHGFEAKTKDGRLAFGEISTAITFADNGRGGQYGNKSSAKVKGLIIEPDRNSPSSVVFSTLGLTGLKADMDMAFSGDYKSRTMSVDKLALQFAELADFDFKLAMGDVHEKLFVLSVPPDEMMSLILEMKKATLRSASMTIRNTKLVQILLKESAKKKGMDVATLIAQNIRQMRATADAMAMSFLHPIIDEVKKFLKAPGTLKITLSPPLPLSFAQMEKLAKGAPAKLTRALGLKIETSK